MEESILTNFQRLPTLKSDFVGLSTTLGVDEELGFADYLRGWTTCLFACLSTATHFLLFPSAEPSAPEAAIDLHAVMEHRLGM